MKLFFNKERGWTTLIIVLLLLLLWSVVALFQRVSSNEKEQNVITTASDLYWFDQAINTHLNHAQLQVWGLAREIDNGSLSIENFNKRSESILNDAPELTNIIWLDADGQTKVRASNEQAQLPKEPIARDLA